MASEEHAPVGLDEDNQNSSKSSKQDVDIEATLKVHKEEHKEGGKYIKSMIYGGLDGIVSVFVTVAAASGSTGQGVVLILILGIAKLVAGGISMGVGDWLSTAAEVDMAKRERKREEWETDNFIEGEIKEMIELYEKKGVPKENAERIIKILSKYKRAFVDIMMAEELGIPADTVDEVPYKHGMVNFGSFMLFGCIPLIAYVVAVGARLSPGAIFYVSMVMTAITMLFMGFIKGKLTGSSVVKSALTTLLLGALTAFVGWITGFVLNKAFPGVNIGG